MSKSTVGTAFMDRLEDTLLGHYFAFVGGMSKMVRDTAVVLLRNPPSMSSFVNELYYIGVKSFLMVAVTAIAVGLVMSLQFGFGFARFGAKLYTPKVVTLSIVRELGPIFTALMLSGRVGAGITSEVGSMRVTQQIDAIRALGTDPIQKIVAPKIIAATLACPMLTIMADMLGVLGGMMVASTQLGLSAYDYFFKAFEIILARDVIGGVTKSLFFGFIIGLVGCYYGMNTTGGTQGVGNATTKSVVSSSIMIVFSDFLMTKVLWIIDFMSRK